MNCMYENIVDFYNNYFKSLGWFLISWEYTLQKKHGLATDQFSR